MTTLKLWQNPKTPIVTKVKTPSVTKKAQILEKNHKNLILKNIWKLKRWQKSKTQVVKKKLRNWKEKKTMYDKTQQKYKLWPVSKIQYENKETPNVTKL